LASFSPKHKILRDLGPFDNLVHIGANTGQEMAMYYFFKIKNVVYIDQIPELSNFSNFVG
jgi:hypothetical protein